MDPHLVWEIGQNILKELLPRIVEEAEKIDTKKYQRIRFVLEFNIDSVRDLIIDSGVEVRYRRDLSRSESAPVPADKFGNVVAATRRTS